METYVRTFDKKEQFQHSSWLGNTGGNVECSAFGKFKQILQDMHRSQISPGPNIIDGKSWNVFTFYGNDEGKELRQADTLD